MPEQKTTNVKSRPSSPRAQLHFVNCTENAVHMDPDELVALHDARELASSGNDVTETELTEALPSLLAFRVQLADNHVRLGPF